MKPRRSPGSAQQNGHSHINGGMHLPMGCALYLQAKELASTITCIASAAVLLKISLLPCVPTSADTGIGSSSYLILLYSGAQMAHKLGSLESLVCSCLQAA